MWGTRFVGDFDKIRLGKPSPRFATQIRAHTPQNFTKIEFSDVLERLCAVFLLT